MSTTRFEPTSDGVGILHIPDDARAMARLDAQHRMAETSDVTKSLPFVIYYDLTPEEEVGLFTIINDKHKGLTKSLVDKHRARLYGDDVTDEEPHLAIAVKLNEHTDSPWFKAIDTGGQKEKTSGTKRRVTLRTFQEATREMISGPRCQNAEFETKYTVVLNYWKAIVKLFPSEWANPRKNLITKGVGVHALSAVGRDVVEARLDAEDSTPESFEKALAKLAGFDWGNKTSVSSVVGGKKGVKFATALLNRVIFGSVPVDDVWEEAKKSRWGGRETRERVIHLQPGRKASPHVQRKSVLPLIQPLGIRRPIVRVLVRIKRGPVGELTTVMDVPPRRPALIGGLPHQTGVLIIAIRSREE